jgi:hypothetical protein
MSEFNEAAPNDQSLTPYKVHATIALNFSPPGWKGHRLFGSKCRRLIEYLCPHWRRMEAKGVQHRRSEVDNSIEWRCVRHSAGFWPRRRHGHGNGNDLSRNRRARCYAQ